MNAIQPTFVSRRNHELVSSFVRHRYDFLQQKRLRLVTVGTPVVDIERPHGLFCVDGNSVQIPTRSRHIRHDTRPSFRHPENQWTRDIPSGQIVPDSNSRLATSRRPRNPVVHASRTRLDGPQDPLCRRPCRAGI